MSIGAGIFLMTAGAILAFGIRDDSGTVDLNVVGVVIMLAGAAGIWLSYYITNRRARVETNAIDPVVEEEYRTVQNTMTEQHPTPSTRETPPHAARPTAPPTDRRLDRTSRTERRIDLDPAASDLHTPTPYRSAPPAAAAPEPLGVSETDHSRSESLRKQLRGRLKVPHLPGRHGNR
ncbi:MULTISPECIES: DUF6458 family protein [unclassified Kribbella]|uniref:DUF6458 family protein n=1 Tax=unclassified Kribbella TaxID=2644121 RepID=UPI0033FEEC17